LADAANRVDQGTNSTAVTAVTTLFKPNNSAKSGQLVAYSTAYDSSAAASSPSRHYYATGLSPASDNEDLLIYSYLQQGYSVVSPDYETNDVAFSPGRLEGHANLDSMRAVVNYAAAGLGPSTKIVAVGYSGAMVSLSAVCI
jgi:hypothetical protein